MSPIGCFLSVLQTSGFRQRIMSLAGNMSGFKLMGRTESQMTFFFPYPQCQVWKDQSVCKLETWRAIKPGGKRGNQCVGRMERLSRGWWESGEGGWKGIRRLPRVQAHSWQLGWSSSSMSFQWRAHISFPDASKTEWPKGRSACRQWKALSPVQSRKLMSLPFGCQENEWIFPLDSDSQLRRWAPLRRLPVLQAEQSLARPSPLMALSLYVMEHPWL